MTLPSWRGTGQNWRNIPTDQNVIKPMKFFVLFLACLALMLVTGCSTVKLADAEAIQGTWKGQELRNGHVSFSWLSIVGRELEFRAADGKEWYKATFTLQENTVPKQLTAVITQCPITQYVGKAVAAIYQLETDDQGHGRLVITGNAPGNPQRPSGEGDRESRQIIFTKD
jgi:uncharacterized protein (TIGR03067 family)